ncbi:MAG: Gx transporter family protein [Oscillospiraceae bacterium]
MKLNPFKSAASYVAITGIMLALAAALTTLESLFSAFLPAGVRIGLANIVVLCAAECINAPTALLITLLKSVFVLLTRGFTAGVMSLCGGLPAFAVTIFMLKKTSASYIGISVSGAVLHIFGQLFAACFFTGSIYTLYYAPLLLVTAVASGFFTGAVSGRISPLLKKRISRL